VAPGLVDSQVAGRVVRELSRKAEFLLLWLLPICFVLPPVREEVSKARANTDYHHFSTKTG
jgi:hypothetical protein